MTKILFGFQNIQGPFVADAEISYCDWSQHDNFIKEKYPNEIISKDRHPKIVNGYYVTTEKWTRLVSNPLKVFT